MGKFLTAWTRRDNADAAMPSHEEHAAAVRKAQRTGNWSDYDDVTRRARQSAAASSAARRDMNRERGRR